MLTRHGLRAKQRAGTGPIDSTVPSHWRSQPLPNQHILTMSSEPPSGQVRAPKNGLSDRIKSVFMSRDNATRIRKRKQAVAVVWRYVNTLRCVTHLLPLCVCSPNYRLCLLAAGYLWLFALPLSQLGVNTYIDENALQPSQVPSSVFVRPMHANFVHL